MIPQSAITVWKDLGIQLGISLEQLTLIKDSVHPGNVVVNCKEMLEAWIKKSGKTDELIRALKACELNAYAQEIEKG